MRLAKQIAVWVIYLAICTALLFGFTLAPVPALALYLGGYLLVLYVILPRVAPPLSEEDEDTREDSGGPEA